MCRDFAYRIITLYISKEIKICREPQAALSAGSSFICFPASLLGFVVTLLPTTSCDFAEERGPSISSGCSACLLLL